jgi:hypothetical protein
LNLAAFQEAQQLGLDAHLEITEFVRKSVPFSAARTTPGIASTAPVNAPRRWPNNWLHEVPRHGGGAVGALRAGFVNEPREHFLACAVSPVIRTGSAVTRAPAILTSSIMRANRNTVMAGDDERATVSGLIFAVGISRARDGNLHGSLMLSGARFLRWIQRR